MMACFVFAATRMEGWQSLVATVTASGVIVHHFILIESLQFRSATAKCQILFTEAAIESFFDRCTL